MFNAVRKTDPEVADRLDAELARQRATLDLIASENAASQAVLEALGSPFTNKYAEGYPGRRYYAGNVESDAVERLAIDRAKALFGAEHANVQPHSGSQANAAAYAALAERDATILSMDLAHGGHLTHGSPVSLVSRSWKFVHYGVSKNDERIDMDAVREIALREKPRILLAGATAYPRAIDFAAFRKIAEECGAYFMVDMAHIAGLVAGGMHQNPVDHADVVTFTTHKTLRGPRGGAILCTIADRLEPVAKRTLSQRIDSAVFPGSQGGTLMHAVAAKAVAFLEAATPEYKDYQRRTVVNARALAAALAETGARIVTGGTDNHLVLVDLSPLGVTGKDAETRLERAGIVANRNMIPFDPRPPMDPSGLRLGTPTLTARGCDEEAMRTLATAIGDAITQGDAGIEAATKTVNELCAAFPLYPDFA